MELTGQAKEDFEKWFLEKGNPASDFDYFNRHCNINEASTLYSFGKLPESMRYGVYVDFAECQGVYISIKPSGDTWVITLQTRLGKYVFYDMITTNRSTPRQTAINAFDKIYNENN